MIAKPAKYLGIFCAMLFAGTLCAQTTKVTGKVLEAGTNEPVPFANVYFVGTKSGVMTDLDGKFSIETYYASDSLRVSFLGFKTQTQRVQRDKAQNINFLLEPSSVLLEAAVVRPTDEENPAHPIVRGIIKNKDINNREKLEAYEYEVYNKVEFDLNNFSDEFTRRKVMKPFNFIFENIDSTEEKVYLPVFMTESMSDFYFRKNPKTQKEIIKATKVSGIENRSVSQFLGDMYQNVNIYDNNIVIFSKSFVSPISNSGFAFYKYYLMDSTYIDNKWCYQIKFIPRRKQELTFSGEFWVNDTTYAIKQVDATIADDANINWIQGLRVRQEYNEVEKEVWMLTKDNLVIDFNLANKTMGVYGRKTTTYRNFSINRVRPPEFYSGISDIIVADDASEKSEDFWTGQRHEALNQNELAIYNMVDTMLTIPQFRSVVDVITLFVSGYKEVGLWEFGPYYSLYSYNPIEGNRLRIGGRTSNQFSRRFELNGHLAFGLRDQQFKYAGGAKYMVTKVPRQLIEVRAKQDIEQLGQSDAAFTEDNVLSSVFRRNPATKLTNVTQLKFSFEREWFYGLSNQVIFDHRLLRPLGDLRYEKRNPEGVSTNVNHLVTTEVSVFTRFAFKEKFLAGEFDRVSLGTKWPTLELMLTYGFPNVWASSFEYQRAVFRIRDKIRFGPFGYANLRAETGKIWGRLPYPLLILHQGNETFMYDETAFNTMNFFEFVSDEYVMAAATWHMEGLFLNKVPLFRRLKWREVASAKAVVGNFNPKNEQVMLLPVGTYTLTKPFAEAAIGVENIFKFLRLDLLYRLSYLDHPNIVRFGLRAKFQIDF